jgi:hypothetical protein
MLLYNMTRGPYHDIGGCLHDGSHRTDFVCHHLAHVFEEMTMAEPIVIHTLRQITPTAPEIPQGRPLVLSIDTAIHNVRNRDPLSSLRHIVEQIGLRASRFRSSRLVWRRMPANIDSSRTIWLPIRATIARRRVHLCHERQKAKETSCRSLLSTTPSREMSRGTE